MISFSVHTWIHLVTVILLAVTVKRYWDIVTSHQSCDCSRLSHERKHCGCEGVPTRYKESPQNISTSVWCYGETHTSRLCHFHNFCFSTEYNTFLFSHGPESVMDGVPNNRFQPTLMDLSSVTDHNAQYFNFIDIPSSAIDHFHVTFVEETTLIFNRFHPDNVMHVFHDDLLPMWYRLISIDAYHNSQRPFDIQLLFMDEQDTEYQHLYQLFSIHTIILKSHLTNLSENLVCFADMYVGVPKSTVWYQYGFHKPQGPVSSCKITVTEIHRFKLFVQTQLGISSNCDSKNKYIVILSRKFNRLIVNEAELALYIMQEMAIKVITLSNETHSIEELIRLISCATGIIGVHGSLLILGLFLRPESFIIELFPYAVNPEHYTPYKTMSEIPGMGIVYMPWRNTNERNTITHPNHSREEGGISYLTKLEQNEILASIEVPLHLCCHNPEWLFRIYQDTIVDTNEVIELLHQGVKDSTKYNYISSCRHSLPSSVENLKCDINRLLHVEWSEPWNLQYLSFKQVHYEIWIQEIGKDNYRAFRTFKNSLNLEEFEQDNDYCAWVKCIIDDEQTGPITSAVCNSS